VSTVRVVPAEPRHLDVFTALARDSDAYRGRYASVLDDYRLTGEHLVTQVMFAAEDDGEVLGFYGLLVERSELDVLFVANAAQGRGIGRTLVAHALAQARQHGLTTVRVVSHPPAAAFYERVGARRIGVVPARPPKVTWDRPELLFDVPE
jgi:GNAT superfamily N-acetyltransferase